MPNPRTIRLWDNHWSGDRREQSFCLEAIRQSRNARFWGGELQNPLCVCVFRLMLATDSAASRPPIPRYAGRVFRGMPATPSGSSDIRR